MSQHQPPVTLDPYRLPRQAVPARYDLRLEPDLIHATFAGQETITLTVSQPTSDICLNAIELDIISAKVAGASGQAQEATIALDEPLQRCRFTFATSLSPGIWKLTIAFRGRLNDKLRGF